MSTPAWRPDHDPLTPADRAAMGEHVAPRPYPSASTPGTPPGGPGTPTGGPDTPSGGPGQVPYGPAPTPGTAPDAAAGGATVPSSAPAPAAATSAAGTTSTPTTGTTTTGTATTSTATTSTAAPEEELPEPPSRPGVVRHLAGVLLGLLLTPVALLLTAIGTARLAEVAGTSEMGTDTLGAAMLAVGVALLAVVVLLGAWTPALPITGGLVWGVGLGTAYLVVPGTMQDLVEDTFGRTPAAAEELGEAAMSGHLVVVGALLLAAGLATGVARRRGRRWAEGVARAEAARARLAGGAGESRRQRAVDDVAQGTGRER